MRVSAKVRVCHNSEMKTQDVMYHLLPLSLAPLRGINVMIQQEESSAMHK